MKVTRLTRDMLTLNRMKVNTAKLKPDAIREGAELVRRLTGAKQPSDQDVVDWAAFKAAKGV
jgi:RNA polymerase-interacting CarD/CdnL/TRCF family regulator